MSTSVVAILNQNCPSQVADISPAMISRFGHADLLPWLSSGYALGAMNILPWGKSFSVFNLKWTYILTVGLFEVGSAICGAAPNMTALIIGRVIAYVWFLLLFGFCC